MAQHYDPRYARQRDRVTEAAAEDQVEAEGLTPSDLDRLADRIAALVARH